MTPQKQLFLHRPEEGIKGDCWRTALACLLDLEPTEVPHFMSLASDREGVNCLTDRFLAERGLRVIAVPFPGETPLQQVLDTVGALNPGFHHLFSGTSRNGSNHVVIARDGQIVHDPAIDDSGIVGPMDDGLWWVEFLGARL